MSALLLLDWFSLQFHIVLFLLLLLLECTQHQCGSAVVVSAVMHDPRQECGTTQRK